MKKLILTMFLGVSIILTGCNSKGVEIINSEEKIIIDKLEDKRELKEINSEFKNSKVYDYPFYEDEMSAVLELDNEVDESQKDILFIYLLTGLDISEDLGNDIDSDFIKSYVAKCNDNVVKSLYSAIHNNEKYIRIYDYQKNMDTKTKLAANYIENKIGYELDEKELDGIRKLVEDVFISEEELEYMIESYRIDNELKYIYAPDSTYFYFETETNPFNGEDVKIRTKLKRYSKTPSLKILSNELNDKGKCVQTFKTNVKEGEVITLIAHKDTYGETTSWFNRYSVGLSDSTAIVYDNDDLLENENTVVLSGDGLLESGWRKVSEDDEKEVYKLNITTSGVLELKVAIDSFNNLHGYSIWI